MPQIPPLSSFRGRGPSVPLPRFQVPTGRAIIDCGVYVNGQRLPGRFTPEQALAEVRERAEGFVWLGVHQPDADQMGDVAKVFELHPLAAEDAVHAHQRPKLELYDSTVFLVMRTVNYVEHQRHTVSEIVQTGEIMVFTGLDFVVTVRHGDHTELTGVRRELEADSERLGLGPMAVLHAVADHVVDTYVDVSSRLEDEVGDMEEEVFTPRSKLPIEAIYQLKREVVELRRAVAPLTVPLQLLSHDFKPLGLESKTTGGEAKMPHLPTEIRRQMRDVADHHTAVSDRIRDFDESLSSLINAALAKVSVQQNTDMRKISAWAAMAAVPTMIAGIYGMNFDHMPELHWTFGYPLAVGVILIICGGLFVTLRRNNWL